MKFDALPRYLLVELFLNFLVLISQLTIWITCSTACLEIVCMFKVRQGPQITSQEKESQWCWRSNYLSPLPHLGFQVWKPCYLNCTRYSLDMHWVIWENYDTQGFRSDTDPPNIMEKETYATAYDIPTGGSIILVCPNGLNSINHRIDSLISSSVLHNSDLTVLNIDL